MRRAKFALHVLVALACEYILAGWPVIACHYFGKARFVEAMRHFPWEHAGITNLAVDYILGVALLFPLCLAAVSFSRRKLMGPGGRAARVP